ncbi:hypothetical protein C9374_009746 [Naegleria lovaniensis]|uniref:YDG domain-containing protein n=1 Tax=Naegleria lovaniensis TaxID=51637 RepID=A0AA88H3V1_NAELO|nr:uncharacterized protein C9374_009746 [Naegleria lovaniensis]KAG2393169.1 hypothetical protein C9374_009746 [Naegleria lovaniensis]
MQKRKIALSDDSSSSDDVLTRNNSRNQHYKINNNNNNKQNTSKKEKRRTSQNGACGNQHVSTNNGTKTSKKSSSNSKQKNLNEFLNKHDNTTSSVIDQVSQPLFMKPAISERSNDDKLTQSQPSSSQLHFGTNASGNRFLVDFQEETLDTDDENELLSIPLDEDYANSSNSTMTMKLSDKKYVTITRESIESGHSDFIVDTESGMITLNAYYLKNHKCQQHDDQIRHRTDDQIERDMKLKRSPTVTEKDRKHMGNAEEWVNTIRRRDGKKDSLLKPPIKIGSRVYGHRDDVFKAYESRIECSKRGSHTPTQPGISGHFGVPADSIVAMAMGGYGDEDYGDVFIYTGQGGTDYEDQTLNKYNISLVESLKRKIPVRLVRGYQLDSAYAPAKGYRYDGLYWVTDYWREPQRLKSGHFGALVYRYRMIRLEGQPPMSKVKRPHFTPKNHYRPSRGEYILTQEYVKSGRRHWDRDLVRFIYAGMTSGAWGNAFTMTKVLAFHIDLRLAVEGCNALPYPILKETKNETSTSTATTTHSTDDNTLVHSPQWSACVNFSPLPIIPNKVGEKEVNDTLGLEKVYNIIGVPISTQHYQSNLEFVFTKETKKYDIEKQPTLTYMCKKQKRPTQQHLAYALNENGLISTSNFYTCMNQASVAEYLSMPQSVKYDLEDIEQYLLDERQFYKNFINNNGHANLKQLETRKTNNFSRLRNALDNL